MIVRLNTLLFINSTNVYWVWGETLLLLLVMKSVTDRWQKRCWRCQLQVHCPFGFLFVWVYVLCPFVCCTVPLLVLWRLCMLGRPFFVVHTVLFPSSVCHLHLDLVFFNFSLYLISSYLMIFVLWLLGYELYFLIFDPKKIYWLFFSVVVCQWHDLYHAFSAAIFPASRYDRFSSSVVCGNKLNWRHFYCLQCLLKCTRKTKTPPYH